MKMFTKRKGVLLSIMLIVSLLVGSIQLGFTTKAEEETSVSDGMKLLASTTDKKPWTTNEGTHEQSTVTLESPVSLTTLRLQITRLANTNKYKIFEVEILDENGNNIAGQATAAVYGSGMKTYTDAGRVSYLNDGYTESWSYLTRKDSSTQTPTDEYIEFTFPGEVTVSAVTLDCSWCTTDAPYNWRIYGNTNTEGFTYVNALKDIAWEYNDSTAEEKSLDVSVYTDRLRIYIDKIGQNMNYWILELKIIDADGNNVASKATITDSSGSSEDVLSNLVDEDYNGHNPKYEKANLPYSILYNEYIEFSFDEVINIDEVKMYCWYGGTALTAFSVYAQVYEPAAVPVDDAYKFDSENNIISCVPVGTTVLEMTNKLNSSKLYGSCVDIYEADGTTLLSSTTELKTGDVLRVYQGEHIYEEYQIAIFGDVDGDGQATIADTVYTENNPDSLTLLQKYAASLNGWNVIGASGALDWQIGDDVVDSRVIEFDVVPENITSLRLRINVAGLYKNYQIFEIKMYGPDGTNLARNATITVADGMPTDRINRINNGDDRDNVQPYTSNNFSVDKAGLENEYFDFTWSEPVTVVSMELINRWAKSTAPKDFDILYKFDTAEAEASELLVNHAVLEAYQPENKKQLYSDEYVQAVAEKAKEHSGLRFTFVTDTHIDANAGYGNPSLNHLTNATRVSNLLPANAIVHGGDLIDGLYHKDRSLNYITKAVTTLVKESQVPVLMTQGNHDDNSAYLKEIKNTVEQYTTADEWYWNVTRHLEQYNIEQNPDDLNGNYYYVDFENEKVRMLVVNTNDLPYVLNEDGTMKYLATGGDFAISDAQLDWIAAEALDFNEKEGWELVVVSHVPLHYPDDTETQNCRNAEILTDMLEAFQSGMQYNPEPWDGDFAQSVSVDFSTQGRREVIACISGHNHEDLDKEINGILYITTAASLADERAYGTTDEDAFDIFTIDTANKKIYATRFGAGEDRVFTY